MDITTFGCIAVALTGSLIAVEFVRLRKNYRRRADLYARIAERMKAGEAVEAKEYAEFIPEDRMALESMRQPTATVSKNRDVKRQPRKEPIPFVAKDHHEILDSQPSAVAFRTTAS